MRLRAVRLRAVRLGAVQQVHAQAHLKPSCHRQADLNVARNSAIEQHLTCHSKLVATVHLRVVVPHTLFYLSSTCQELALQCRPLPCHLACATVQWKLGSAAAAVTHWQRIQVVFRPQSWDVGGVRCN